MTHSKTNEIDEDITKLIATYLEGLHNPREDSLYNELRAARDTEYLKGAIQALIEQKCLEARIDEVSRIVHELNLTDNPKEVNAFIVKFGIDRLITLEDQAEVQDTSNGGGE